MIVGGVVPYRGVERAVAGQADALDGGAGDRRGRAQVLGLVEGARTTPILPTGRPARPMEGPTRKRRKIPSPKGSPVHPS
jgi:hypothetical protein